MLETEFDQNDYQEARFGVGSTLIHVGISWGLGTATEILGGIIEGGYKLADEMIRFSPRTRLRHASHDIVSNGRSDLLKR